MPLIDTPTGVHRLISPAAAEMLHRTIPGSTLTIFPGMGHELPRPLWPQIVALITGNARWVRLAAESG